MTRNTTFALFTMALLAMASSQALAQEAAAENQAAERPATQVNLSTPKDTARSFAAALVAGDTAAARRCVITQNEEQGRLLDATTSMASSMQRLETAAVRAYGEEGKQVAGQGGSMTDFSRKIDDAREQIDGDNATITVEEEEPMHLRRIDQEWKIDLGRAMPEGEEITRAIRIMNAMAAAARDTAAEITSGQLETAQAAQQALGQRIMAVMMGAMSEE